MKQIQMYEWLIKYDSDFRFCSTYDDVISILYEKCDYCIYKNKSPHCESYGYDCTHGVDEYLEQLVDDVSSEKIERVKSDKVKVIKGLMEEVYIRWFTCLNCKEDYIKSDFKYCPNCGKEIDWERNE